jgi:diketogulonate reductase-like aldo/keto reductase
VIVGARKPDQLDDNLKSIEVALSAAELAQLDEAQPSESSNIPPGPRSFRKGFPVKASRHFW